MHPVLKRPVFLFTCIFKREGDYVLAKCEHAPILTYGRDEDEALEKMERAADVYLALLDEHDEITLAIQAGKLHVGTARVPDCTDRRNAPAVTRLSSGFIAELPTLAAR